MRARFFFSTSLVGQYITVFQESQHWEWNQLKHNIIWNTCQELYLRTSQNMSRHRRFCSSFPTWSSKSVQVSCNTWSSSNCFEKKTFGYFSAGTLFLKLILLHFTLMQRSQRRTWTHWTLLETGTRRNSVIWHFVPMPSPKLLTQKDSLAPVALSLRLHSFDFCDRDWESSNLSLASS